MSLTSASGHDTRSWNQPLEVDGEATRAGGERRSTKIHRAEHAALHPHAAGGDIQHHVVQLLRTRGLRILAALVATVSPVEDGEKGVEVAARGPTPSAKFGAPYHRPPKVPLPRPVHHHRIGPLLLVGIAESLRPHMGAGRDAELDR